MMFRIKKGTKIILFRNTFSEKYEWDDLYKKYSRDYIVKGIIGESYNGDKKMSVDDLCKTDKIVLVGRDWKQVAVLLESKGYTPWKNIFPEWFMFLNENYFVFEEIKHYARNDAAAIGDIFQYIALGKKIATVYGNCQAFFLSRILENTDVINKEYIFCEFKAIQEMVEEVTEGFSPKYMKSFSLFIYQNVSINNVFGEKLATEEYVLKTLNHDVIKVSFPFVYFGAYFPQYITNVRNDSMQRGEGHTPYGDAKIQTFTEQGYSIDQTVAALLADDLFSKEEVYTNLETAIDELRERESKCDIPILDFILDNCQTKYLFYSPSHPTNICMEELAKRILTFLNYKDYTIDMSNVPENDIVEMFIYPCTKKYLKLKLSKENFGFYRDLGKEDSLREYVSKYVQYNFPEFSEELKEQSRTIDVSHLYELNPDLVSSRRNNVLMLNGRTLHLGIYLTAESDNLHGVLLKVEKTYAPKFSYVTPVTVVGPSGGVFPCIMNNEGELYCQSDIKKGAVLIIDTIWNMK